MCVLAFAFDPGVDPDIGPEVKIISNRDEFLSRPTQAAHWWPEPALVAVSDQDRPEANSFAARPEASLKGSSWVLGGRDLRAGGSWFAVSRAGRVAILTNYRDPLNAGFSGKSRGDLVERWVGQRNAHIAAIDLIHDLCKSAHDYAGFNLLLFDCSVGAQVTQAWIISNCAAQVLSEITPGIHGLSNEVLNSPWPKTMALKDSLLRTTGLDQVRFEEESFKALSQAAQAPDEELPNTGIPLERERYLSSVFIQAPNLDDELAYGTRTSTVLTIRRGQAEFLEQNYYPELSQRRFTFNLSENAP
jgi:uncharacterized protein with NRDE domain